MSRIKTFLTRKWMLFPPLLAGFLIVFLVVSSRKGPVRQDVGESALPVRSIRVLDTEIIPRALGYGTVQPGRVWRGVAEVGGKVIEMNPEFEIGALLPVGAVLLRIDPLEYEIAVTEAEARIHAVVAQLKELELERENLSLSLALEEQNLRLLERDFRRNLALANEGSISETVTEKTERDVLRQRLQVQSLRNGLSVLPARREQLQAQRKQNNAHLEEAQRRLQQTVMAMPFAGRISAKNVELGQALSLGAVAGEVDGIERAEIEVGLALDKMSGLMQKSSEAQHFSASSEMFERLGLSAVVRLRTFGEEAVWQAEFSRMGAGLDSGTRTIGLIVSVKDSYRDAIPGNRPPLVKGMLCEVEVRGPARKSRIIPRSALHAGRVYLVGADNRLVIREVGVGLVQSGFAEITHGLDAGDQVVISDLAPAVAGMLLEPGQDASASELLEMQAAGRGGVR